MGTKERSRKRSKMSHEEEIQTVAMIGCGSMGGGMALLLAEKGLDVRLNDPDPQTVQALLDQAEKEGFMERMSKQDDYKSLCESFPSRKVIFLSLPHGDAVDEVVEGLQPYLRAGDMIIDASNEHWTNTERRQGKLVPLGILYIGCGVSGGYQAARRGPSLSPGGQDHALDLAMPLFEKMAAKAADGSPCVAKIGEGGAGHFVKRLQSGIETGIMSAIAESWWCLHEMFELSNDEIGEVFADWNNEGLLKGTYLIDIGRQICQQRDGNGQPILDQVQDKALQEVAETEGPAVWAQQEAVEYHVSAPTLAVAHHFRLACADRGRREPAETFFSKYLTLKKYLGAPDRKQTYIDDLEHAIYVTSLAAFVQGLAVIDSADRAKGWKIKYDNLMQIWRGGCIIKFDKINGLLSEMYKKGPVRAPLLEPTIAKEFAANMDPVKGIVNTALVANGFLPTISATFEWLIYSTRTNLPTSFYEAQMYYFGKHMFDLRSEDAPDPVTGEHHSERKPA